MVDLTGKRVGARNRVSELRDRVSELHDRVSGVVALPYGKPAAGHFETVDRRIVRNAVTQPSGTLRLAYFRSEGAGQTVGNLRSVVAAAGTGTTLAKSGIYMLSTDTSTWTKVGETFSHATMWQSTGVRSPSLAASVTLDPRRLYAVATLWVGTGTAPALAGVTSTLGGALMGAADALSKWVTGQTDLPATIAAGSVVDGDGALAYVKGY